VYAPGPGSADIHNLIGAAPITLGGIIDSTRRDIYDHTVEPNKQQYPDSGISNEPIRHTRHPARSNTSNTVVPLSQHERDVRAQRASSFLTPAKPTRRNGSEWM
jgi:hypothetical protein